MKKLSLIIVCLVLLTMGCGAKEEIATAKPTYKTCDVPSGTIFNRPDGTYAQRYNWHNLISCMIEATPSGATISISIYAWWDYNSARALTEADKRGVNVQLIMWTREAAPFANMFRAELNDGETSGSWFKACNMSCLGPNTKNVHHSKILTFSSIQTPTGIVSHVSNVGSGNPTRNFGFNTWQNITQNKMFYDFLTNRILLMRTDKPHLPNIADNLTVGNTTIFLYPQKNATPDLFADTIGVVNCAGGTPIRMAMFQWTYARKQIAYNLAAKKKQGCDVAVIINLSKRHIDPKVVAILEQGNVTIYDALVGVRYIHAKELYIGGSHNVILTGSQNATRNSIIANDECQIRIVSASVTAKHMMIWNYWKSRSELVRRKHE